MPNGLWTNWDWQDLYDGAEILLWTSYFPLHFVLVTLIVLMMHNLTLSQMGDFQGNLGIVQRVVARLCEAVSAEGSQRVDAAKGKIQVSFVEIYNEKVFDLLATTEALAGASLLSSFPSLLSHLFSLPQNSFYIISS